MSLLVSTSNAQVALSRGDAVNAPSRHAWNLFQIVNHAAKDPKLGRGQPDLARKIGEPGQQAVFTEQSSKDGLGFGDTG